MLNVHWLSKLPAPARRALYFGIQRLVGSRIHEVWSEMQEWETLPANELQKRIDLRLRETLLRAVRDSQYYRSLNIGPTSAGESPRTWLTRFPLLSRELIRCQFANIVIDSLRGEITSPDATCKRGYGWLVVKTGGTTGNPTTVVHDAKGRDWGRATRLLAAKICGHPLGVRYFRLWGSEQDLLQQQSSLQQRVLSSLLGFIPMNAFRAKDAELRQHHAILINHPQIDSMMTYIDAAAGLAAFIEEHGLSRPKLRTIMACAGTVTPEWRTLLQRVFGAEVFDKYGSRDCNDMACECSAHDGLHVISPNCFIEIVDEQNRPCPPGVTGRMLITLLNNHSFPMIRYQVGDLAQWAENQDSCSCGRAWPKLKSIQGRADDMLTTEDGNRLSSVFVRHFVGVSLNRQIIREWQLEQTDAKSFVFRYIPAKSEGLKDNLEKLRESFHLALGKSVKIDLVQVQEIPFSPTGKVRWIINTCRR